VGVKCPEGMYGGELYGETNFLRRIEDLFGERIVQVVLSKGCPYLHAG